MNDLTAEHLKNLKGVGIVVYHQYCILMVKRLDSDLWALAGGSIDKGETPLQAAKRELFEEFGINTNKLKYFSVTYSPANPYKKSIDSKEGCSVDFYLQYPDSIDISDIPIKLQLAEFSEYA